MHVFSVMSIFIHGLLLYFVIALYSITTGIGTWYEAFTNRTQPPAYIAMRYPEITINAERFKRDLGDGGRSIRQVIETLYTSSCYIVYNIGIIW